jgi:hypothetical protein
MAWVRKNFGEDFCGQVGCEICYEWAGEMSASVAKARKPHVFVSKRKRRSIPDFSTQLIAKREVEIEYVELPEPEVIAQEISFADLLGRPAKLENEVETKISSDNFVRDIVSTGSVVVPEVKQLKK